MSCRRVKQAQWDARNAAAGLVWSAGAAAVRWSSSGTTAGTSQRAPQDPVTLHTPKAMTAMPAGTGLRVERVAGRRPVADGRVAWTRWSG